MCRRLFHALIEIIGCAAGEAAEHVAVLPCAGGNGRIIRDADIFIAGYRGQRDACLRFVRQHRRNRRSCIRFLNSRRGCAGACARFHAAADLHADLLTDICRSQRIGRAGRGRYVAAAAYPLV